MKFGEGGIQLRLVACAGRYQKVPGREPLSPAVKLKKTNQRQHSFRLHPREFAILTHPKLAELRAEFDAFIEKEYWKGWKFLNHKPKNSSEAGQKNADEVGGLGDGAGSEAAEEDDAAGEEAGRCLTPAEKIIDVAWALFICTTCGALFAAPPGLIQIGFFFNLTRSTNIST